MTIILNGHFRVCSQYQQMLVIYTQLYQTWPIWSLIMATLDSYSTIPAMAASLRRWLSIIASSSYKDSEVYNRNIQGVALGRGRRPRGRHRKSTIESASKAVQAGRWVPRNTMRCILTRLNVCLFSVIKGATFHAPNRDFTETDNESGFAGK